MMKLSIKPGRETVDIYSMSCVCGFEVHLLGHMFEGRGPYGVVCPGCLKVDFWDIYRDVIKKITTPPRAVNWLNTMPSIAKRTPEEAWAVMTSINGPFEAARRAEEQRKSAAQAEKREHAAKLRMKRIDRARRSKCLSAFLRYIDLDPDTPVFDSDSYSNAELDRLKQKMAIWSRRRQALKFIRNKKRAAFDRSLRMEVLAIFIEAALPGRTLEP